MDLWHRLEPRSVASSSLGNGASICQKDASWNLRGIRATCGERMVRRLAYRGSRRLRELGTLRYPRQTFRSTMKSHKKDIRRFHVQTELSNSSIFLDPNAAKCLPGKPWASLKTNVDSIFRKSKRWRLFGAWMIYIYIYIYKYLAWRSTSN